MRGFAGASCALAAGVVLIGALPARGTQLIYESFNYAVGSNLKDQPGWAEPGGANDTVLDKIVSPSLVLTGTTEVGNALQTGGKYSFDSFIGADDNDPNSYIGGDGNTFWFSFLMMRKTSGNGDVFNPDYGGLLLGANANPDNNLFIGKPGSATQYGLESENGVDHASSGVNEVLGTQGFLVVRITFHDAVPEDVSLYVNPSTTTSEGSLVADASLNLELFTFNDFFISTGTNAQWIFDELKIGTTFADVAPEPASTATLLLTATSLLARRRRTGLAFKRPSRCRLAPH